MSDPNLSCTVWKSSSLCPACNMPFDRRRKRRLLDYCGHERCLSCINRSDLCPLCVDTGSSPPKMSKIFTESSDLMTPSSDFTTPSSDLMTPSSDFTTPSSDTDQSFKPSFHSTPIKPSSASNASNASNASTPALTSKTPMVSAGEPTKPGNPGFNFQLQGYEGIGSPLTLQQTVNRGFRFLPKEEGVVDRRPKDGRKLSAVRAILFRDEDDIANTSKESGFFSSGSETQSCIKYVAKTNSGAPKSDLKVAKTNSDHAVKHGPSKHEPGYLSKLLNSPSQARITRAGPRINQAAASSQVSIQSTHLSEKPIEKSSEKSSELERESAKPLPEISAKNRIQKSWKPVPDKIPKRKLDLQIERNSLYKPFQKIYSFKAKFTDKRSNRRSNSKAQLDLSDSPSSSSSYPVRQPSSSSSYPVHQPSSSSSYPVHQPILTHSLSDPQLEKIQLARTARHSDRDSDVSSEVSTIRSVSSRKIKLSSSRFQQTFLKPLYFEVPSPPSVSLFTGREWLYREIMEQLMSNLPTNRGVLITGGPGSGKTATILALVERSCFGSKPSNSGSQTGLSRSLSTGSLSSLQTEGYLGSLSKTVVSYHFCQADNATTCRVPEFIHSVSAQISQSPQLSAYFHLIQVEKKVRDLLSISHCTANPSESLVSGVLEPLKLLRKTGKISGEICTIVLDGLCEAEQHRPDFGDSIGNFLAKHLLKFPPWLKIVCTVRSQVYDITRLLPFFRISLDSMDMDERLNKDMKTFIDNRIEKSKLIRGNIRSKVGEQETLETFTQFLVSRAKGCFLYSKLVLDLIERGQLVLKSGSYKVIPRTLSEIFLLIFNLRFSTSMSYEKVSEIFAICLSSLQSLSLAEVFKLYSSLSLYTQVDWAEFKKRYISIQDLLVSRSDGSLMFFHPTLRDWLVKRRDGESERFLVDVRTGHAAIAFSITRYKTLMRPEKILTMVHHVLKANLNKNTELTDSLYYKDLQAVLISLTTDDVSSALGSSRNIYSPNLKVSKLLLLAGASPDHITEELDQSPLLAVYSYLGILDMVKLLLEYSADTNQTNNRGQGSLFFAAQQGHCDVLEWLIDYGAQLNLVSKTGVCSLVAAAREGHLKIVELLVEKDWLEAPDHLLSKSEAANQALVAAAQFGHKHVCEYLLDLGYIQVDQIDHLTGLTCLAAAAAAGHKQLVHLFIKHGARVRTASIEGETALHLAARHGCWDVVDLMVRHDPELVQVQDIQGRTSVAAAAIGGHLGVVELLLERGGLLDHQDSQGYSPLHHAVLHCQVQVVRLLLDQGAEVDIKDNQGRSCLSLSVDTGDIQIIEILLDFGANMEVGDGLGVRPLEKAISQDKPDPVSCFLRRGAKLGSGTWISAEGKPEIQMILINKILEDGNTLFRKNKLLEASHRYKYALRRIPRLDVEWADTFLKLESHLLLNLSRVERRLGNLKEAEQLAQQVLEYDEESVEALVAKAKAYRAGGRKEEALSLLSTALNLVPTNREISRAIAKLRDEVEPGALVQLVQLPPYLGSIQSIPYIDDSSTNCSSIAS